MKLNKLLERQIKKTWPDGMPGDSRLERFINAVNNSYIAYERDIELFERASRITEDEYKDVNRQLKQELDTKDTLINKLKEAVHEIDNVPISTDGDENELLNIASYLKGQIIFRRESEKKLLEQKQFYEQILSMIPSDIVVFDNQHRYLFVNPVGIKNPELREWIIGKTDEEYCVYRNRDLSIAERRRKVFNDAVNARQQVEWEDKITTQSGEVEYHLRKMYPVFRDGGLQFVIGYGINITERKKIEEKVRLSEKRYKNIFDNSQALICTHDLQGNILEVNSTAISVFGYELGDLVGKPLSSLLLPDKREGFNKEYLADITEKGKASGIMVALNKNGERIYLLYQNFLLSEDVEEPYVIGFSQDITARIEAERALKRSEEKYRGIIANMNLGMMELDADDNIVYVNNSFCEMSGYELSELTGQNVSDIFLGGNNSTVGRNVAERRVRGESDAYELKVKNKNGEPRWWLISGAPLTDAAGNYKGSIGIHLDITGHKLMETDLRAAKLAAENSAKAKEVFLANMSHEIRTPMNAIIGIGRQLAKTRLDNQQATFLNTIHNAADNLLVIINDLLDFSKIEAGKITLETVGCSIEKILKNTVQTLRHKAEEKGLLLNLYHDPALSPVHIGDPYRINQVLLNLVSNAIKFTEQGAVSIECRLLSAHPESAYQNVRFSVIDTGIGMSEEFLGHIFEKFSQEDESITRRYGGTGLGMGISKQLIELMGGEVHVESKKNKGTTISFSIDLPVGTPEALPMDDDIAIDANILRGISVLVVEDNEMNRLLAETILSQYGATMTEAENGEVAIRLLDKSFFDVVLMDVRMPVKDGVETTKYIRNIMGNSIPIIALTANAFKAEETRCIEAGMNDFISKPFDEKKLVQKIAYWSGAGTNAGNLSGDSVQKHAAKQYNTAKLEEISRGNDDFVKKMLGHFIKNTPELIAQMHTAFDNNDFKTISFIAHKLKPSADILCINSVAPILESLEEIENNLPQKAEALVLIQTLDETMNLIKNDILENYL